MFRYFPKKLYQLMLTTVLFAGNTNHLVSDAWQQPPPLTNPTSSGMTGATDGNGNAVAAWLFTGPVASYYTNGTWGPIQTFDNTGNFPNVAMDASGTALLIYTASSGGVIRTSYLSGGVWSTPPPDPLETITNFAARTAIDMNGLGQGVAVWNDTDFIAGVVRSSFFSAGSWSAPVTIGTGVNPSPNSVAYSANGDAVAIWLDFSDSNVNVANYIGGVWQPQTLLDSSFGLGFPLVAMDANGNPLAAWISAGGDVIVAAFDGANWLPTTIATGPGNAGISLAMAPGGTGIITWQDSASNGFSRSFNGTTWEPSQQFGSDLPTGFNVGAGVSVDSDGNALVLFYSNGQVLSSYLPLGGNWETPLVVHEPATEPPNASPFVSALSSNRQGFAFWTEEMDESEVSTVYASVLIPDPIIVDPLPPTAINGSSCTNKFAVQKTYTHTVTWLPSPDPTVLSYYVRRNGVLVAVIPANGPYIYTDGNRCRTTVLYTLTAVNAAGESTPLNIVLN